MPRTIVYQEMRCFAKKLILTQVTRNRDELGVQAIRSLRRQAASSYPTPAQGSALPTNVKGRCRGAPQYSANAIAGLRPEWLHKGWDLAQGDSRGG